MIDDEWAARKALAELLVGDLLHELAVLNEARFR
jgi:hypothetical protein